MPSAKVTLNAPDGIVRGVQLFITTRSRLEMRAASAATTLRDASMNGLTNGPTYRYTGMAVAAARTRQIFNGRIDATMKYKDLKNVIKCLDFMLQNLRKELFAAELPVKVRWLPSLASNIYHTAVTPCGYVHDPANYRTMLQWEAREMELVPCSACPWDSYEENARHQLQARAA